MAELFGSLTRELDVQEGLTLASGIPPFLRDGAHLASPEFRSWLLTRDPSMTRERYPDALKLKEFLTLVAERDPQAMDLYHKTGLDTSDWDAGNLNPAKLLTYLSLAAQRNGAEAFSELMAPLGLSETTLDMLMDPDLKVGVLQQQLGWILEEEDGDAGRRRLDHEKTMEVHPARIFALEDLFRQLRRETPEAMELYASLIDPHLSVPLEKSFFGLASTNDDLLKHLGGSLAALPQGRQDELRDAFAAFGVDRETTALMLDNPRALSREMRRLQLERTFAPGYVDPLKNLPNVGDGPTDKAMWQQALMDMADVGLKAEWRYEEELFRYAHGAATPLEPLFQTMYPDRDLLRNALPDDFLPASPNTVESLVKDVVESAGQGLRDLVRATDVFLEHTDESPGWERGLVEIWRMTQGAALGATFANPLFSSPEKVSATPLEPSVPHSSSGSADDPGRDFMSEIRALVDASNQAVNV